MLSFVNVQREKSFFSFGNKKIIDFYEKKREWLLKKLCYMEKEGKPRLLLSSKKYMKNY